MSRAVKGLWLSGLLLILLVCAEPAPAPALQNRDMYTTMKATFNVFKNWCKAIDTAGLTKIYQAAGENTMFAPTDDAFAKLKADDLAELFGNRPKLIALVTHHTIEGKKLESEELAKKGRLRNTLARPLLVRKDDTGNIRVNGVLLVTPDVACNNGIVHGIDAFLPLTAPAPVQLQLEPFTSKEFGFTVLLPGKPKEDEKKALSPLGELTIKLFVVETANGTVAWLVSCSSYPGGALKAKDQKDVLDAVAQSSADSLKGKVLSQADAKLDKKYPGKSYEVDAGPLGIYRANAFLVGDRLYQIVVLGPKDIASSPDADKFLDSFQLVPMK